MHQLLVGLHIHTQLMQPGFDNRPPCMLGCFCFMFGPLHPRHHAQRAHLWGHRDEEKVHFEQVGLLALPGWVTAPVLEQWLQEACEFAAEWAELRPLHQNRLCGRCLRAPLQVRLHAY